MPNFLINKTAHGTQNFVSTGWAEFTKEQFLINVRNETASDGLPLPSPLLLFNQQKELVACCMLGIFQPSVGMKMLNSRYTDGTAEALPMMLELTRLHAHKLGCSLLGGYVPSEPWVFEMYATLLLGFKRGTQTEQWEYKWCNTDYSTHSQEFIEEH